jgi:TatD DNase family protein
MNPVRNLISNGVNVKYIDAHCHLQFEQYEHGREEIIMRMRDEGVAAIVVGTDLTTSEQAVALAEIHEHLFATVGLHPGHSEQENFDAEKFRALAKHPKIVAIGECGLDYYRVPTSETAYFAEATKAKQKELLQQHIELAVAVDKPLVIHVRATKGTHDAYQDLIKILEEAKVAHPELRGDIHFFAGDVAEAKEFFALDFTISFTAVITFARDYDDVIKAVPLASILGETDAPYVAPASRRGQRNDPLAVKEVVERIAAIRGEDPEAVRTALLANTERLFALQMA